MTSYLWWLGACFACCLTAASGLAQPGTPSDVPADVPVSAEPRLELPPLPPSFTRREAHGVRWGYPDSAAADVEALIQAHPQLWQDITAELGVDLEADLEVRVGRSPEELERLAPRGAPPPAYASGVAYPGQGLVLLSLVAPDSWLPPDLHAVYAHELSHMALHRAVEGHPIPRWLSEGLAIYQAREQRLARVRTLWEATVTGNLIPLGELDRNFPSRPHEVNIAYAQSGDIVQHLLEAPDDLGRFRRVIRDVSRGVPFAEAVEEAYYVSPEFLEREWRADLQTRFTALPLILTGGALWALLGLMLVWAFVTKRRRDRRTLARWAEQEAAAESGPPPQVVVLATRQRAAASSGVAQLTDTDRGWQPGPSPRLPHHTPPSGVPTVEHDGRHHTLH